MAYLAKGKKQDLVELSETLGVVIGDNFNVVQIKEAIIKSPTYDEDFTKECLIRIINDRKETELKAQKEKEKEELKAQREKEKEELKAQREKEELQAQKEKDRLFELEQKEKDRLFELEKLKLQLSVNTTPSNESVTGSSCLDADMPKLELKKLVPDFDPKTTDMSLFLDLFEKQLTFLKVPVSKWVVYLVGLLPTDVTKLIAKESAENAQDYEKVKQNLLQRFKLSAEKFRQLFAQLRKDPETTWRDFYFDLQNYFDGWLKESKVSTFEGLKDLIVADQIKRRAPPDYKDHFLDNWSEWNDPLQLADKLDYYEDVRNMKSRDVSEKKPEFCKRDALKSNKIDTQNTRNVSTRKAARFEDRPVVSCYGCGNPGFIRSTCPTCSPSSREEAADFKTIHLRTFSVDEPHPTLMRVKINELKGIVCADTGASHNIAGDTLYHLLRNQGVKFEKTKMNVTLADGLSSETEVFTTQVEIEIEGRSFEITLHALPAAKDNRTLLGTDFLRSAGIVLDLPNHRWFYHDNPKRKFRFDDDDFSPSECTENAVEVNTLLFREDEEKHLSNEQSSELSEFVSQFEDVFKPGEGCTPKAQRCIDNGNNPLIAVPPYRIFPSKKEYLKKRFLRERVANENARGSSRRNDMYRDRNGNYGAPMHNRRRQARGLDKVDGRRDGNHQVGRYGPPTRTKYRLIVKNLSSTVSWQNLKDYMRQAGKVTYANAHKLRSNEGIVEFSSFSDMKKALDKLDDTDLSGRRIKLVEYKFRRRRFFSRSRFKSYSCSDSSSKNGSQSSCNVSALQPYEEQDLVPMYPIRSRGQPRETLVSPIRQRDSTVRSPGNKMQGLAVPTRKQPPRKASCMMRTSYTA